MVFFKTTTLGDFTIIQDNKYTYLGQKIDNFLSRALEN